MKSDLHFCTRIWRSCILMALGLCPFAQGRRRQLMRKLSCGPEFIYMHSHVNSSQVRQGHPTKYREILKQPATARCDRARAVKERSALIRLNATFELKAKEASLYPHIFEQFVDVGQWRSVCVRNLLVRGRVCLVGRHPGREALVEGGYEFVLVKDTDGRVVSELERL